MLYKPTISDENITTHRSRTCTSIYLSSVMRRPHPSVVSEIATARLKHFPRGRREHCRRQVKNVTKVSTNYKILEFGDYIWNHREKCIQVSTNMPGINLETLQISRIFRNKNRYCMDSETNGRVKRILRAKKIDPT